MPISFSPPFDLPLPPCPNLPSPLPFPFPWPFPPWAMVPIGLTTLLPFPFPRSVVPTEPPDLPCFTSLRRVHAEEGKCLRRWPGASKRPSQAGGEVPLPNGGWWALGGGGVSGDTALDTPAPCCLPLTQRGGPSPLDAVPRAARPITDIGGTGPGLVNKTVGNQCSACRNPPTSWETHCSMGIASSPRALRGGVRGAGVPGSGSESSLNMGEGTRGLCVSLRPKEFK